MFSSSSPTSFLFQGSLEKKPEAATILLIQTRVSLHILTYNFEYIHLYIYIYIYIYDKGQRGRGSRRKTEVVEDPIKVVL